MSWAIFPQIIQTAYTKKLFDEPNDRKLHKEAVPRLGGFAFLPIFFFSIAFVNASERIITAGREDNRMFMQPDFLFLFCGLILLYFLGIRDDLTGVRYRSKFAVQFTVAALIPLSGLWISDLHGFSGIHAVAPCIGVPFTILLVVFIMNAVNLIDGIDGLAASLCILSLAILGGAFLFYRAGEDYALPAFATVGLLIPFFFYNVFGQAGKSKIFMGDSGSLTLGYIIAFLAIRFVTAPPAWPHTESAIALTFGPLAVPVFDVCRVILVRARKGLHLFTADRNHIHHKFLTMGFSPRAALLAIFSMSVCFTLLNAFLVQYLNSAIILLTDALLWTGLHLYFNRVIRKREVLGNYKI
ncbi:MAG: undecaprenyl/decaprenyl-phosphate alpha-N-acetylglucosaminyl 1-phosphate transferase [Tannerellaceae bacterium]|nr:undecaprenyl/decaprenyl-phosphate alpha-N-acetylglucosaminyl 1-phosphate transferase [Tannerellaceae bacterium]